MQKGQAHTVGYTIGTQYAVGVSAKRSTHTVDLANIGGGDHYVKVCPWCGVGLLRLFFLCCGVLNKLTLLLVLAAPVKRKGARGEVRFPGDPATMCPVLF